MFRWLKRYMPRSLYARALLILLLPVLTLQLVISVSFIQRHFEGVTRQMTATVILEMGLLTREVAAAGDLAAAQAVAAEMGAALELEIALPGGPLPQADGRAFYDLAGVTVIAALTEGIPNLRGIELIRDRSVILWLEVPQGMMEVMFLRKRVSASNPHQLIVLIVVLGALLTVISYIFLRNQLRPIKRMSAAATAFGKGRMVPFTPTGATEVRAAGTAFLDMRARIERQTQQRTLMLSGVSHDLRTPLTRLKLGLSMLDDPEAGPLRSDVEDMERLIDGFLDFARGDAEDDLSEVDVAALVGQVVADCKRAGQAVTLAEGTGAAVLPLRGMAIRRALENLINNALRYGTRAVVSVTAGERSVRITVEDDGPGIPPEAREEAMRPFTRLDPARNQDRGSGVGLGLAIVADIARTHGGMLRLGESAALGGLQADLVLAR